MTLLVRGGTVVSSGGTYRADVLCDDGRIAAIGPFAGADEVLDASGLYVLPGVIDGHVHFREPGFAYKEDFESGSRSAVMGGVTTVLEMPNTSPVTSTAEAVEHKRSLIEERAYCDVGLFGLLPGDLRGMADAGVIGFKCFLGPSTGDIPPPDDGTLLEAMREAAALGPRLAFHAENDAIVRHETARLQALGRRDAVAHSEGRPVVAEVEAIQRVCLFAASTGARIHILHLSTRDGLAVVQDWRGNGVDVTCEVTPHHALLSTVDAERIGSLARINPPLREPAHAAGLLEALKRGEVDCVATDHAPHLPSEKLHDDIWQAVSGFAGVEISLRLFLGQLPLTAVAQAMCEAPAKTWGLWPRKGTIQVGSDADLTIVDFEREDTIEASRLHGKNNLSPFEGMPTKGMPVATIVRGQVVMRDGELVGRPCGRMVTP